MPGRLEEKIAIIIGGAGYIGAAITQCFNREGAHVVIADLAEPNWDEFKSKAQIDDPDKVTFIQTDACDKDQVQKMVTTVIEKFGQIDVLVPLVGGSKDAIMYKMTDEQWDSVINLNLNSAFYACRAVGPQMLEQKYGKIILMSSRSYKGNIGQVNYSAAKAGLIGFTNSLAREMARYNVNVNIVVPGFVDNPRLANMAEKFRQMRIELNPFQTAAEPKDVAEVIVFLASDEACQITGQAIHVACW